MGIDPSVSLRRQLACRGAKRVTLLYVWYILGMFATTLKAQYKKYPSENFRWVKVVELECYLHA